MMKKALIIGAALLGLVLVGAGIGGYAIAQDDDPQETLSPTVYHDRLDAVCTRVGDALDSERSNEIAGAMEEAIADVEALATPPSSIAFQEQLVGLAARQADLLRSLSDAKGARAETLGAELEQVGTDIDALFAEQGGFEVCGQA
jgi:hypothetical protein